MVDCVLKKGSHLVCQDYTLTEILLHNNKPIPFVVVADGCSSGERTEIGAQLLCLVARQTIIEYIQPHVAAFDIDYFIQQLKDNFKKIVESLSVPFEDALATLKILFIFESDIYHIEFGDGFLFYFNDVDYIKTHYTANAPYYLAYETYEKTNEFFAIDNLKTKTSKIGSTNFETSHKETITRIPISSFSAHFIGIATDGLDSYINDASSPIPCTTILENLNNIKNPVGSFLKRRFKRMSEDFKSQKITHYDDVAIAMIDLDEYRKSHEKNNL